MPLPSRLPRPARPAVVLSAPILLAGPATAQWVEGDRLELATVVDTVEDGKGEFLVGDMAANEARGFSGADGSLLYTLNGEGQGGSFGAGHFIDDVSGDGRPDILLGAWGNDAGAELRPAVHVLGSERRALTHSDADKHVVPLRPRCSSHRRHER